MSNYSRSGTKLGDAGLFLLEAATAVADFFTGGSAGRLLKETIGYHQSDLKQIQQIAKNLQEKLIEGTISEKTAKDELNKIIRAMPDQVLSGNPKVARVLRNFNSKYQQAASKADAITNRRYQLETAASNVRDIESNTKLDPRYQGNKSGLEMAKSIEKGVIN